MTGKIMLTYLETIGAAGIVVDGAIRGADEIARRSFPCFARGVTCRGPYKHGPGEINVPVAIDETVDLYFPVNAVFVFDATTGRAVIGEKRRDIGQ